MKIILASTPTGVPVITAKIEEFVGKPANQISVAIINEASAVEDGDSRWLIKGLNKLTKTFGGNIEIVNLSSLDINTIQKKMDKADIIWCFGGSTDWLKVVFERTGFDKLLPKLLKSKVWVGSSAGSCIMGKRNTFEIDSKVYSSEKYFDVKDYLSYINAFIYPHGWSPLVLKETPQVLINSSKSNNYPVYLLSEKSALIMDNEKDYLIGKKAWKIVNGKIVEKI